jgi:gamma-glutamyltranspeptidase/glutathione hydrolase
LSAQNTLIAKNGLVTSSHELSSSVGVQILEKGGNVVDAAIATSAMLCVVQNNLCGVGGDFFALVKSGSSKISGLNGSGRAGKSATLDFYLKNGNKEIPKRGPLAALTVPGIVHAWGELLDRFGSMELRELLAPAIRFAESGVPLTAKYTQSIEASMRFFAAYDEFTKIFLPSGKVPEPGFLLRQKDLSSTLREISVAGVEAFYKGDLALKIVKGIQEQGGILTEEDFSHHVSTWDEPLRTSYRGNDVYETAPNSQAASVILWLNILEHFDLQNLSEQPQELVKVFIETYMKVNHERSTQIADPDFHKLPTDFTTKRYAEAILNSNLEITSLPQNKKLMGDTTYFAVGDSEGNCVSAIQSNYMGFGSGLVPKGTGIVLQNRGSYFTLDPRHHNTLLPAKRTFHTLCASIGEKDGNTLFALGSMGGDIQPQIQVQLITKIIDLEMDLQSVIDAPRWAIPGTIYETPTTILLERDLDNTIGSNLQTSLTVQPIPSYSSNTGHAQALLFKEGSIRGAADQRGDGKPVGF